MEASYRKTKISKLTQKENRALKSLTFEDGLMRPYLSDWEDFYTNCPIIIAEMDEKIIGWSLINHNNTVMVYVKQSFRRNKIDTNLINKVIRYRNKKINEILCCKHDKRSTAFYETFPKFEDR